MYDVFNILSVWQEDGNEEYVDVNNDSGAPPHGHAPSYGLDSYSPSINDAAYWPPYAADTYSPAVPAAPYWGTGVPSTAHAPSYAPDNYSHGWSGASYYGTAGPSNAHAPSYAPDPYSQVWPAAPEWPTYAQGLCPPRYNNYCGPDAYRSDAGDVGDSELRSRVPDTYPSQAGDGGDSELRSRVPDTYGQTSPQTATYPDYS